MTKVNLAPELKMPFAELLGITVTAASPDCVKAELLVREDLCTDREVMHGGAIMAFADSLGAFATVLNLPDNSTTTTVESKTNFFAPARVGTKVLAETTPLHRGRRTMVWQTRVSDESGRLLALVIQTQIVLKQTEG